MFPDLRKRGLTFDVGLAILIESQVAARDRPISYTRRDVRVVYGAGLENQ